MRCLVLPSCLPFWMLCVHFAFTVLLAHQIFYDHASWYMVLFTHLFVLIIHQVGRPRGYLPADNPSENHASHASWEHAAGTTQVAQRTNDSAYGTMWTNGYILRTISCRFAFYSQLTRLFLSDIIYGYNPASACPRSFPSATSKWAYGVLLIISPSSKLDQFVQLPLLSVPYVLWYY